MTRSRASWGVGVLVGLVLAASSPALAAPDLAAAPHVPDGWAQRSSKELAPGLVHTVLVREAPAQVANVATIGASAPYAVRTVLSNDAVAEEGARLERTSSMCARTRCLVAVNGDFAHLDSGQPVGGVVSLGEMQRSPTDVHHQLLLDPEGRFLAGPVQWSGRLMPTDLRRLDLTGVNVDRGENGLVLYTSSFGATTATNPHGAELTLEVLQPQGPIRLGQTVLVRLTGFAQGQGSTGIPPAGGVLSGHGTGAQALADLWSRVQSGAAGDQALLRIEMSPGALESVGGSPVLLRDGKAWFSDVDTPFVRGRHPRTAIGWNASGETFLVTVDGRQPGYSEGMTLAELASLMLAIGATEGINLDGGGSTTFVASGQVVNRPSDRLVKRGGRTYITHAPRPGEHVVGNVERPVVVGIVIVPRTTGAVPPANPLEGTGIRLPQTVALAAPVASDPASQPSGALPAIVPTGSDGPAKAVPLTAAAVLLAVAVLLSVGRAAPVPLLVRPLAGARRSLAAGRRRRRASRS